MIEPLLSEPARKEAPWNAPLPNRPTPRRRAGGNVGLLALGFLACAISIAAAQPATVTLKPKSGAMTSVTVEVVATPEGRTRGLMFRSELAEGQGMLFVFPETQPLSFWMKNTLIPLDIIFIDDRGKIIRIHKRTTPHSERRLPSGSPARFVLEVPGGYAEKVGLRKGDEIDLGELAKVPAS